MRTDQQRRCLGRLGLGQRREAADDRRQFRPQRAAAHPVEQVAPGELVGQRVRQAQQVAMRPAVALLVLDRLVGELVDRTRLVPPGDRAAQAAAPAAHGLHGLGELEQMRAGARDLGQRRERGALRRLVAERGRQRQREERRIVLRRTALGADLDDARDGACAVGGDAADHGLGVLARERALAGVIAAALGAEHEEAIEADPIVDRKRVSASRVRYGAGDRLGLRRPAQGENACVVDHAHLHWNTAAGM
jgi:hypothetical protein